MVVKQNYRILITWRNVIKNIDKYKHIFNNKKIKFDLIQERQNVKEKTLLKIICIDVKIITIKIEIPTNRTKKFSMELSFLLK